MRCGFFVVLIRVRQTLRDLVLRPFSMALNRHEATNTPLKPPHREKEGERKRGRRGEVYQELPFNSRPLFGREIGSHNSVSPRKRGPLEIANAHAKTRGPDRTPAWRTAHLPQAENDLPFSARTDRSACIWPAAMLSIHPRICISNHGRVRDQ